MKSNFENDETFFEKFYNKKRKNLKIKASGILILMCIFAKLKFLTLRFFEN